MRRNDFSGAKAWMGAEWVMRSRITWRFSGRKMAGSVRLVKRRVFEGGVGGVMGGILERSRVRFERREAEEEDRECCGEVSILKVVVVY